MKQFIYYVRLYFVEVLSLLVSVCTLALSMYGALCFVGKVSTVVIVSAVLVQVVVDLILGKYIESQSFQQIRKTLRFLYLWSVTMMICGCFIYTLDIYDGCGLIIVLIILAFIVPKINHQKNISSGKLPYV